MLLWFVAKNVGILFGYMLPAYQTFKALDTKDKDARAHLLRYWAVFATFASAEFYTDMFVSWLPFYYEIKMLILLYLSIPFTKGSSTVYEMHMKPWLRAHEAEIDEALSQVKASLLAYAVGYRDRVLGWAHEGIISFCQSKLPAALPLYMMLISFATETFNVLFAKATAPAPPLSRESSTESLSTCSNASLPNELLLTKRPVEKMSLSCSSHVSSTAPLALSMPSLSLSNAVSEEEQKPHPSLVNANVSKSAANVLVQTSSTRVSTRSSHKRDASAPVATQHTSAKETKSKATKKQALQGTAMPTRPISVQLSSSALSNSVSAISRPAPQFGVKKEMLEEDSILTASPTKRSSNPKIVPTSPLRRSAV